MPLFRFISHAHHYQLLSKLYVQFDWTDMSTLRCIRVCFFWIPVHTTKENKHEKPSFFSKLSLSLCCNALISNTWNSKLAKKTAIFLLSQMLIKSLVWENMIARNSITWKFLQCARLLILHASGIQLNVSMYYYY